jgi:hypothetical protein
LRVPLAFAAHLAPEVRAAYRRVWVKPEGRLLNSFWPCSFPLPERQAFPVPCRK